MSSSSAPSKRKWLKTLFRRSSAESLANSSSLSHEPASSNTSNVSQPSTHDELVENLQIAGRFAQSMAPKIAGCVDANPAKTAFNILSLIMEVRKGIIDSKDELQTVLEETLQLLGTVFAKLEVGSNSQSVANQTIEQYTREITKQLERVESLNNRLHSSLFRQIDYENYKVQVMDISRKIGGSTNRFNIAMAGTTGIMVDELRDNKREEKLRKDLQPSEMADHRFIHDGKSALQREVCVEGTRVSILNDIKEWANESSPHSPPIFWLTGQAGSGKTTIAYTITKWFEQGQPTVLGANFLCSRQFQDTRNLQRIIPTIAFQLAHHCKSFRDSLQAVDTSGAIHSHNVYEQVEKFLFRPWKERKGQQGLPIYLVVVDALDEIEGSGGSTFLEALLSSIEVNKITGLKLLVTSRPDPDIAKLCETFPPGAVCQLHKVPIEDAKLDIKTYLENKLRNLRGKPEFDRLNEQAAGLFIYAATIVKILTGRKLSEKEQLTRLGKLLSSTSSVLGSIDMLYQEIMVEAFADVDDDEDLMSDRLRVFHTFLCSAERVSTSVGALLMDADIEAANIVLENLHAVLYVQNDRVYWYHASFPDFIFARDRSNFCTKDGKDVRFWCNPPAHHGILANACFRIMKSKENGLRFNMGDIKSSYLLDNEHAEELRENVDKNISSVLRYSCFHWAYHLTMLPTDGDQREICSQISDFLQIRILYWIEAINLLGSKVSPNSLQDAKNWVSKIHDVPLVDDLHEAINFATHFVASPAAQSTPHLYISSLSTWQSESTLSRRWKREFARIPAYKHTKRIVAPLMTRRFREYIKHVSFSSDGRQVVVAAGSYDPLVVVLDATTFQVQHTLNENVDLVQYSGDRKQLVGVINGFARVHNSGGLVYVWDASTFQLLRTFTCKYATISRECTEIAMASATMVSATISTESILSTEVIDISTGARQSAFQTSIFKGKMALSSTTRKIVVNSGSSVQIWDISTSDSQQGPILEGHTGTVKVIAISRDNKIATGSIDHTVRVWDASTGYVLAVLPHNDRVRAVNFSYDNTRLVSGSSGGVVRIWDIATGTMIKLLVHSGIIESVAFSPDDTRIVSGSNDGSVHVWSSKAEQNGDPGGTVPSFLDAAHAVTISDDGTKLLTQSGNTVQVWDASTGAEIKMNMDRHTLVDENTILSNLGNGVHEVRDITTGHGIMSLDLKDTDTHAFFVESLALSRCGKRVITCICVQSADEQQRRWEAKLWDMQTGQEINNLLTAQVPFFLAFSRGGEYVVVARKFDHIRSRFSKLPRHVTVCDALTGHAIQDLMLHSLIEDDMVLYSTNGKEIAICQSPIPTNDPANFLFEVWDISSRGRRGVINSSYRPSNNRARHLPGFTFTSLGLSNDGKKIVLGCDDGTIGIWDAYDGSNIMKLAGHLDRITSLQLSRDDKQIVSGSYDGSIRLWELDSEKHKWALHDDGWITSSRNQEHRLMWVHKSLEVSQSHNILVISKRGYGFVDFERAMVGEDWINCYTPQS